MVHVLCTETHIDNERKIDAVNWACVKARHPLPQMLPEQSQSPDRPRGRPRGRLNLRNLMIDQKIDT